ncbi:GTP cyclohydrolase II [Breoghania sp.]|uniref:GTP cyclohydrolase II n=1 Tax=Breoghania sp. TaxID=2065378 RepID=UPI002AA8E3B6|nr:GTP cyclohydrolase II [Breoghania sp.]
MLQTHAATPAATFGDPLITAVHRALGEMQGLRPLALSGRDGVRYVLAIDDLDDAKIAAFLEDYCEGTALLVLSAVRAKAMGLGAGDGNGDRAGSKTGDGAVMTPVCPQRLAVGGHARLMELATAISPRDVPVFTPAGEAAAAAVELAKLAQRLPACLISSPVTRSSDDETVMTVKTRDVEAFRARLAATYNQVSEARVPIADGIDTRFAIFRNAIGGIATAILVGDPKAAYASGEKPVPVRVHSSCATGDIFGSRRCDCGEQLQLALHRLRALGGGCLIYLDQEGRGLGLANKMHAYALQDRGLDTVDANKMLGFHDDERDYHAAGFMLKRLGFERINLLTNNPTKLHGLATAGIEIVERMPVVAPANAENMRYLTTKAKRSGHLLDDAGLLESL